MVNGLPLWRGGQIAVDPTLVSPLQRCGEPCPCANAEPGCVLRYAEARQLRTYPELRAGGPGCCQLVVCGGDDSALRPSPLSAAWRKHKNQDGRRGTPPRSGGR